jgi:hypothetical protein
MPTVLEEREQVITPDERVAPRDDVQRDDGI